MIEGNTDERVKRRIKKFSFNNGGHVSLVDEAANASEIILVKQKNLIIKSKDDWKHITGEDLKNAKEQTITAPILIPGTVDYHGDTYDAPTVKAAMNDFIDSGMDFALQHSKNLPNGGGLTWISHAITEEPIILPGGSELPAGTWLGTAKLNDVLWDEVVKGTFTGFSIKALGTVQDIEMKKNKSFIPPKAMDYLIEKERRKQLAKESVEIEKAKKDEEPTFEEQAIELAKKIAEKEDMPMPLARAEARKRLKNSGVK